MSEEWKKSTIVLIYKQDDKTDHRNYRDISPLTTTYVTQHTAVKVNSICIGNFEGSSVWISTQQVKY